MRRPDKPILRAPETYGERAIELARVAASIVDVVPVDGWYEDGTGWRKTAWWYVDTDNNCSNAELGIFHRKKSGCYVSDPEWHVAVRDTRGAASYSITQVAYEPRPHVKYNDGLTADYFDLLHPVMAGRQGHHLSRLERPLQQNPASINWQNAQKAPTFVNQQEAYTTLVYAYHLSGKSPSGRVRRMASRALGVLGELRPMYARHVTDYQSYLDEESLARVAHEMRQILPDELAQPKPDTPDRDESGW